MGFFKSLGRTILGHSSAPRIQSIADNNFHKRWREESESHFKGLNTVLDTWRGNEFLRDLTSTARESRIVSRETGAIRGGVQTAKANIRQGAARSRLGKGFAARQEYQAEEQGSKQVSRVHGEQAERRAQIGHQVEGQYAQTKADILESEHADTLNRENFRQQKNTKYAIGRDANRSAMRGKMLALGAAVVGGGMGAMGVGGLGASAATATQGAVAAGGMSGAMAGLGIGAQVGGMLGGQQSFGQGLSSAFQGNTTPRMPDSVGFSPFLSYAMGQMMQPQGNQSSSGNAGGLQLPGPTMYDQANLRQASN